MASAGLVAGLVILFLLLLLFTGFLVFYCLANKRRGQMNYVRRSSRALNMVTDLGTFQPRSPELYSTGGRYTLEEVQQDFRDRWSFVQTSMRRTTSGAAVEPVTGVFAVPYQSTIVVGPPQPLRTRPSQAFSIQNSSRSSSSFQYSQLTNPASPTIASHSSFETPSLRATPEGRHPMVYDPIASRKSETALPPLGVSDSSALKSPNARRIARVPIPTLQVTPEDSNSGGESVSTSLQTLHHTTAIHPPHEPRGPNSPLAFLNDDPTTTHYATSSNFSEQFTAYIQSIQRKLSQSTFATRSEDLERRASKGTFGLPKGGARPTEDFYGNYDEIQDLKNEILLLGGTALLDPSTVPRAVSDEQQNVELLTSPVPTFGLHRHTSVASSVESSWSVIDAQEALASVVSVGTPTRGFEVNISSLRGKGESTEMRELGRVVLQDSVVYPLPPPVDETEAYGTVYPYPKPLPALPSSSFDN